MLVPKRPFVSLQRNTKFYSRTQMAIRFFTAKYKILYPKLDFVFKTVPKRPISEIFKLSKLYPDGHSFFQQGNTKFNYLLSI